MPYTDQITESASYLRAYCLATILCSYHDPSSDRPDPETIEKNLKSKPPEIPNPDLDPAKLGSKSDRMKLIAILNIYSY